MGMARTRAMPAVKVSAQAVLLEMAAADALYHNTLNQTKKQLVINAMGEAKGSPVEAARLLGIHPKYLHRLIKNLNLKAELKRVD